MLEFWAGIQPGDYTRHFYVHRSHTFPCVSPAFTGKYTAVTKWRHWTLNPHWHNQVFWFLVQVSIIS